MPDSKDDLSKGVAIGSGVYIDQHTHIEAVRYPEGSDTMSLLTTILTGGRPGPGRVALWAKNLIGSLLLHPFKTVRLLLPFRWARECVILLCMQALEGHIDMRWERHVYWPFRKFLVSRGHKVPTFIPAANEFAQKFASVAGGTAMSMLPEILFNVPGTAHCLGGSVIADSPGARCRRLSQPCLRLPQYVRVRWLGGRRESGGESQPHHHCAYRARHELHSAGAGDGVERRGRDGSQTKLGLLGFLVSSRTQRGICSRRWQRKQIPRCARNDNSNGCGFVAPVAIAIVCNPRVGSEKPQLTIRQILNSQSINHAIST